MSERLKDGIHIVLQTDSEKDCYQLLNNLDHVAYKVSGSLTFKKYMRNKLYSLMAAEGVPSWYVMFAPTDHKHLISLYWADMLHHIYVCIKFWLSP